MAFATGELSAVTTAGGGPPLVIRSVLHSFLSFDRHLFLGVYLFLCQFYKGCWLAGWQAPLVRFHLITSDYIGLYQITSDYIRLHQITSDYILLLQTTLNYCGIGLTSIEFVRALSCKQRIMCTNSIFTGWLSPFPCSDARLFSKKMRTLTGNSPVNVPVYVITFYL